jgi:Cu(I)/Ag(I) efflux system membrane fusion protein
MTQAKWAIALVIVLFGGLAIGRWSVSVPDVPKATQESRPVPEEPAAAAGYTCSMHPQVRQPGPGKCPICAMDLIPVAAQDSGVAGEREISLSPHAKALARIATVAVERRAPEAEVRLFGRVVADESRLRSITARFPGRIERLYVNYTGVRVSDGDHLARIYSPELLTAQAELLSARRFSDSRALGSAREKLALWGLSRRAIAAIEAKSTPTNSMDIDAPLGGFVVEKLVDEGDYVDTGSVMFRIADLSSVWIVLDAYEIDKPWLRFGQPVSFTAEALPGQTFEGRIAFIPPVLDPETRTFKVRVNLPNEDLRLRPGMFVTGVVRARLAGQGVLLDESLAGKWISPMHPEIVKDGPGQCDVCGMALVEAEKLGYAIGAEGRPPVVVPATAVLRTGRRAIVYVEVAEREDPTYEGREILLGPRAGDVYVVAGGLEAGERVVVNGAFKLDSALQLLARPSMMSPPEATAAPSAPAVHAH